MTQPTDETTKQLIEDLRIALGTWVHQYAPDCCEQEAVERALRHLQDNCGTLGYIASLNRRIKDWQVNHADHA